MTTAWPRIVYVAWRSPRSTAIYPVAQIVAHDRGDGSSFELAYIAGAREAESDGFVGLPSLEDLHGVYVSDQLFPFLQNRLMPKSRPDYDDYLSRLGLSAAASPLMLLSRSSGRRETDTLEVFGPPQRTASRALVYYFFVRGVRHIEGAEEAAATLKHGDLLSWELDVVNRWDTRAVAILCAGNRRLGYVPATLLDDFHALLGRSDTDIRVIVEKLNPSPAPMQQRILCRLEASDPGDFVPFSSGRYQAINRDAAVVRFDAEEYVS